MEAKRIIKINRYKPLYILQGSVYFKCKQVKQTKGNIMESLIAILITAAIEAAMFLRLHQEAEAAKIAAIKAKYQKKPVVNNQVSALKAFDWDVCAEHRCNR
jgi:hypothetical protein